MRLSARVVQWTGTAHHWVGGRAGAVELPPPARLEIVEDSSGYYTFHYDESGELQADDWAVTVDDAKVQARFAAGISLEAWVQIEDDGLCTGCVWLDPRYSPGTGRSGAPGRLVQAPDNSLVWSLAGAIEERYPGHVLGVNARVREFDIDVLTRNAIVEVGGWCLPRRIAERTNLGYLGYTVVAYCPGLDDIAVAAVEAEGGLAAGDMATLLQVLAP